MTWTAEPEPGLGIVATCGLRRIRAAHAGSVPCPRCRVASFCAPRSRLVRPTRGRHSSAVRPRERDVSRDHGRSRDTARGGVFDFSRERTYGMTFMRHVYITVKCVQLTMLLCAKQKRLTMSMAPVRSMPSLNPHPCLADGQSCEVAMRHECCACACSFACRATGSGTSPWSLQLHHSARWRLACLCGP